MKDFFISYNSADRQWAEWIAWELEEAGYSTLLQVWDFRPGSSFTELMERAIAETERTIAVLSPDYLASSFSAPEWAGAFTRDPTGKMGLLIPVRVRDTEPMGLLASIVYIDLVGLNEESARAALTAGIQRSRARPTKAPPFPSAKAFPSEERSVTRHPVFPGSLPPHRDSPEGNEPGKASEPPAVERNAAQVFAALNDSARRAIGHADRLRLQLGRVPGGDRVHMEHLIAGLYENPGGPARRIVEASKLGATDLATLLEQAGHYPVPTDIVYEGDLPSVLPPVSNHVREAIEGAWRFARIRQATVVTSRDLLFGALSVRDCGVIKRLAEQEITLGRIGGEDRPALAGYRSDDADGVDRLNIMPNVRALASVLAAKDVHPPLSLGLFGDWGSGKSFFMHKMETYVEELKIRARGTAGEQSAFCPNIVQLRFNAWHYIDTENLWATLAFEVFEGLAEALERDSSLTPEGADPDAVRAHLLAARVSSRDVLADAELRRDAAQSALMESAHRLKQLEGEEARIRDTLTPNLITREAFRFVATNPDVQGKLLEAGRELGFPTSKAAATNVQARLLELQGTGKRAQALALSLRERRGRALWIALAASLVLVLLVIAGVSLAAEQWLSLRAVAVGIVAFASSIYVMLRPVWNATNTALGLVEDAQARSKQMIEEKKATTRQQLERERDTIRQQVADAQHQVESAERAVSSIDRQLLELRADHRMMQFIKERHGSSDYRSRLGVIAHAREDFERLSQLLSEARERPPESTDPVLPQIDRIILYIDDLDRCPEDKVVQVLQAIHLLLAFPLFVVVVGVDARWLLHSLRQHSAVFRNAAIGTNGMITDEQAHWKATPLNYLEKIFQIPFTLEPMDRKGFSALVDDLTRDSGTSDGDTVPVATEVTRSTQSQPPLVTGDVDAGNTSPAEPTAGAGVGEPATGSPIHVDLNPQFLKIEPFEREYMKELVSLIPSPRVAKRFINVYRLLKASIEPERLETFLDDRSGGEYRVVMLLLAMSAGYPAEASDILVDLMERDHPETWREFLHSLAPGEDGQAEVDDVPASDVTSTERHDQELQTRHTNGMIAAMDGITRPSQPSASRDQQRWQELIASLESLHSPGGDDQPCASFAIWARSVARFSFLARPVLVARGIAEVVHPG
jgi:hypothetical protein